MTRFARLYTQFAITAVLAIVLSFSQHVFVDRVDYMVAISNYAKDPSHENDAILRAERAKNERMTLMNHLVVAGLLCSFDERGMDFGVAMAAALFASATLTLAKNSLRSSNLCSVAGLYPVRVVLIFLQLLDSRFFESFKAR